MIKLLFKTTLFVLLFCSVTSISKAQIGYDYAQYDIGFGGVANKVYGDAETVKTTPGAFVNFTYNHTPFVNYVVEFQAGKLEGGHPLSTSGRYFKNIYKSLVFRAQLQAGELIDYSNSVILNGFKNLYISSGFGYVINDIREVNRQSPVFEDFYTFGEDKTSELYIPVRLGYEFKIFNRYNEPQFRVDVAYTFNTAFGQGLDGYINPYSKASLKFYNYVSVGVKYCFGSTRNYRKDVGYSPF